MTSEAEVEIARRADFPPDKIYLHGNGKTEAAEPACDEICSIGTQEFGFAVTAHAVLRRTNCQENFPNVFGLSDEAQCLFCLGEVETGVR